MGKKAKMAKKNHVAEEEQVGLLIGEDVPFAVQEAYKTLRTNITFSLPGKGCKKILVTSASQHEGKSTTAINLALTLADMGARVLLMDCDLRLPTIGTKLGVQQTLGLTHLLFEMNPLQDVLFQYASTGMHVILAGNTPPNPSEILASDKMEEVLNLFSEHYDYIIMDAPPVGIVTDASILSRHVSGVILVVREGMATFEGVGDALSQLRLANAKMLGFVLTGVTAVKKNYKKYYK